MGQGFSGRHEGSGLQAAIGDGSEMDCWLLWSLDWGGMLWAGCASATYSPKMLPANRKPLGEPGLNHQGGSQPAATTLLLTFIQKHQP